MGAAATPSRIRSHHTNARSCSSAGFRAVSNCSSIGSGSSAGSSAGSEAASSTGSSASVMTAAESLTSVAPPSLSAIRDSAASGSPESESADIDSALISSWSPESSPPSGTTTEMPTATSNTAAAADSDREYRCLRAVSRSRTVAPTRSNSVSAPTTARSRADGSTATGSSSARRTDAARCSAASSAGASIGSSRGSSVMAQDSCRQDPDRIPPRLDVRETHTGSPSSTGSRVAVFDPERSGT